MKFSRKNIESWRSWKMSFFFAGHFDFFFQKINKKIFPMKTTLGSNEVSFFSALWIVSSESWKTTFMYYFAHDCRIWWQHCLILTFVPISSCLQWKCPENALVPKVTLFMTHHQYHHPLPILRIVYMQSIRGKY